MANHLQGNQKKKERSFKGKKLKKNTFPTLINSCDVLSLVCQLSGNFCQKGNIF